LPNEKGVEMNICREPVYDIHKHRHIFSAWAAGRASSVASICRFPVESAFEIIEHIGLQDIRLADDLPSPDRFNISHREWRKNAVRYARNNKSSLFHSGDQAKKFTHGIAAKMINIYFKSKFLAEHNICHQSINALHPPIDRLLLNELAQNDAKRAKEWRRYRDKGWSKFSSKEYEEVIDLIVEHQNGAPLWKVERYWPGHQ
jgi:hypothetical protein